MKINCKKCFHHWEGDIKDSEIYFCHKCGYDNKKNNFNLTKLKNWMKKNQKIVSENYKNRLQKLAGIVNESNIQPHGTYGHTTIKAPIISDGILLLSENPDSVKFNNKVDFENFLSQQKYFSASYSHCFYTPEEYQNWSKNGSKYEDFDSEQSVMLFETGRELVAVWDNKNSIGYIIPSKRNV